MQLNFFLTLFLSSSSLLIFWLIYQFFLVKLTHFNWQRGYLVSGILFSLSLPFLPRMINWLPTFFSADATNYTLLIKPVEGNRLSDMPGSTEFLGTMDTSFDILALFSALIVIIYLTGLILKVLFFLDKLNVIHQLIQLNPKTKIGKEWHIRLADDGPAFSFFNYIFLSKALEKLSASEIAQIIAHEQIHSQQKHSLDIIFVELAEIFLWFHPAIYKFKNWLKDIHEYLVDEAMTQKRVTKKRYAHLLLKLSTPLSFNSLTTGFTSKQIGRRISMLAKSPSASYHKLKFLVMIPIITSLLLFSACFGDAPLVTNADGPQAQQSIEPNRDETALKIGTITWVGNTVFTDEELNEALQLQKGDVFDNELLDQRLNWDGNGTDISSLYMNRGYAYFTIEMETITRVPKGDDYINLTFKLFEGVEVSIANVSISGNKNIPTDQLMTKIDIKQGDVFNRSKIIAAQKALFDMGKFDPEQIGVNTPILPENNQLINIEFSVVELK